MEWLVAGIAYTLACAGADRLRGMGKIPGLLAKTIYALVASTPIVALDDGYWGIAFVIIFIAGSAPGWGNPLGLTLGGQNNPPPERWQVGPLVENTPLALAARASMWLGLAAFLTPFTDNVMYAVASTAMFVAFVAAPYIARATVEMEDRWAAMEIIRGGLFGALVWLGAFALS